MPIKTTLLRRSVAVAALVLPFSVGVAPGWAQDEQQQNQTESTQQQDTMQAAQEQQAEPQPDALVATVGDIEIRSADVIGAIQALPPQVQQMPTEMLIPAVVDQLIISSLIVEQARSENLQEDPEVVALVQPGITAVEDQALAQVWLQREFAERVTDETVQQAYSDMQAANPGMTQSLEELRPGIEQNLRQQAMNHIRSELQEGVEITLYGPGGEPLQPSDQATGSTTGDEPSANGQGETPQQ